MPEVSFLTIEHGPNKTIDSEDWMDLWKHLMF